MNPLIKRTVEKITGREYESKDEYTASIIGAALHEAMLAILDNPVANLNGGDSINEHTIGSKPEHLHFPNLEGIEKSENGYRIATEQDIAFFKDIEDYPGKHKPDETER